MTPEHKYHLLSTRDHLFDCYLDALTRLNTWQVEERQLLTTIEHTNAHSRSWRRRDLMAYLTQHLADISEQLRTIDALISPTQNHQPPCD